MQKSPTCSKRIDDQHAFYFILFYFISFYSALAIYYYHLLLSHTIYHFNRHCCRGLSLYLFTIATCIFNYSSFEPPLPTCPHHCRLTRPGCFPRCNTIHVIHCALFLYTIINPTQALFFSPYIYLSVNRKSYQPPLFVLG